jgi:hypothetical protein
MNVITYVIKKEPRKYLTVIQSRAQTYISKSRLSVISRHKLFNVTKAVKGTAYHMHFRILRHACSTQKYSVNIKTLHRYSLANISQANYC